MPPPVDPLRRVSLRAESSGDVWRLWQACNLWCDSASHGISGTARSAPLEFDLGPNGVSGLELAFEVARTPSSR